MVDELMGDVVGGYLSAVTIGAMEDLGYQVDYDEADLYGFDKLDKKCSKDVCKKQKRFLGVRGSAWSDRNLNEDSEAKKEAEKKGKDYMKKLSKERPMEDPEGLSYVGDKLVVVLYEENDAIRSLVVKGKGKK